MPFYRALTPKNDIPCHQAMLVKLLRLAFGQEFEIGFPYFAKTDVTNIDDWNSIGDVVTGLELSTEGAGLKASLTY